MEHNTSRDQRKRFIRRAAPEDLPAIAAIQQVSPEASPWNPLDHDCCVAVENSQVLGFLVSRSIAADESEILNVAVHPLHRRRGLGKTLVESAIKGHPGTWFLEVRESNTAALNLYRSLGFVPAGRRENYYNDPPEAAIVMRIHS